jgi:uncharacterized membrane protein YeaQ/YmgE (transglycosylase-associated protein family)
MTIFTPSFIVAAIAYFVTNTLINNSPHGWYGVLAAGVVGGLVAGISNDKKGE